MPENDQELPRSAAQMQAALDSLTRANELKDELLARLSHDLRTPLGAVLGWAKALEVRHSDPAALARGLDAISRNAAAQARLLEELLAMNQILSGKFVLEPRPVDIAAVVAAAIDKVRPAADAKELRLEPLLQPLAPATVSGDPDRLQQVLVNLLANAVEFTPPGGRIEVLLRRDPNHLELTVRDEGIGIEPALLAQVFDPLRPADASARRPRRRLGLGLAVARQLVELHGGSIEASSAGPGTGATFVVRLPLSA